jgi:hypothetical protein
MWTNIFPAGASVVSEKVNEAERIFDKKFKKFVQNLLDALVQPETAAYSSNTSLQAWPDNIRLNTQERSE